MIVIKARNVNDAYRQGMTMMNMRTLSKPESSRVGPVHRIAQVVTTTYTRPTERVLFDERRDANPFFHLFEALWMLTGHNDLETPARFLPSFAQFSDDGETLHGAYGFRWRHAGENEDFDGVDQLAGAITMLTENPSDRRVIIQMWDVNKDFGVNGKDIPCNDMIHCQIVEGKLNITVFCRSNDIVLGAYGANAVHMSMLHEYLALMIGVPVGMYEQISCNYHAYVDTPYKFASFFPLEDTGDPYDAGYHVVPLIDDAGFDSELLVFMNRVRAWQEIPAVNVVKFKNSFFLRVAWPMYAAFRAYKQDNLELALTRLENPERIDWLAAGQKWLMRRMNRRAKKEST